MSTALVKAAEFTHEQVELIKASIAKGATDDELKLFLATAQRTGLDPFKKQCYLIPIWDSVSGKKVKQFVTGIDGLRLVAQRSREYAGQVGPWWCGPDGAWVDVWLSSTPPHAARVGVMRSTFPEPIYSVALYKDYCQRKMDGSPNEKWSKNPEAMLAKCAEALSLRRAFPQELSGLYIGEEFSGRERAERPTIQVSGSHAEPAAEPEPEPAEAEVVKASGLPRIPDECSMALAEVTSRAGLEEVYRKWVGTARAEGWWPLLESAAKKRASDFPAA
jgi:phage recombination protein Bet